MLNRLKGVWLNLRQTLGFVPTVIVALFAAFALALVEVDRRAGLGSIQFLFSGDDSAARTVLSVIAGSLITVAGLTFSITMVVLQLASSQFSPRILRTFFGDRLTQVTIGTYVGTFVYSILVLRAVGGYGTFHFVPRLSMTVASLLGIGAVVLLIAFLHHVSKMVQVSEVTARIARSSLAKIDELYPDGQDGADPSVGRPGRDDLLAHWSNEPSGEVLADRPGYVQRVSADDLLAALDGRVRQAEIVVAPGDFVSAEYPIVRVWPPEAAADCRAVVRKAISVTSERDLAQDLGFGLRQLTDIALKAMSPGINDPMTAVTCIGYLRSILVRLTSRPDAAAVLRHDSGPVLVVRNRSYAEQVEVFAEIDRYLEADAWVTGELLQALTACAAAALAAGRHGRLQTLRTLADAITERSLGQVRTTRDRDHISGLRLAFTRAGGPP